MSYTADCSRSIKLTAQLSNSPIKQTVLLVIRAVSLTGLFLFLKKSTSFLVKLIEDRHYCIALSI